MSYTRTKRVTDPLDDKAKARIVGCDYSSSGSEHSADINDVVSPSFSDLFPDFDDHDYSADESDSERDPINNESIEVNVDLIKQIVQNQSDEFQKLLVAQVSRGVLLFSCAESNIVRRNVMAFLRDSCGYNAAICKTKWRSSAGITAGNYEFIDVIRPENSTRYFVDLDFASEFEIARPMSFYERLMNCVPRVFVGKSEDLKVILRNLSGAALRSMKSRGLPLPPWRKLRFVKNKWFGPYRRTTNLYTTSFCSPEEHNYGGGVKCRTVGFEFDAAVNGGGNLMIRPARDNWSN